MPWLGEDASGDSAVDGPTEAINGRLEHLRVSALGFRTLPNYVARSLLKAGGFRPTYTPDCDEPAYEVPFGTSNR